jgi:hypothetical protein
VRCRFFLVPPVFAAVPAYGHDGYAFATGRDNLAPAQSV